MSERKTFFEQVPVETVKKICQEKNYRSKERIRREDDETACHPDSARSRTVYVAALTPLCKKEGTVTNESQDLRYPEWQRTIQAALLEFDPEKLQERISVAEAAISARLDRLSKVSDGDAERMAIEDGLRLLSFLKERPSRLA